MAGLDRSWMVSAKCRHYPADLFFPPAKALNLQQQASNICASCPVKALCRAYAEQIHATHGVWGGVFINRTTFGTGTTTPIPHGTPRGASRHYKLGENPCRPCLDAAAEAAKTKRRAQKAGT